MRRQWRLKDAMESVAMLAIYLAAVHSLAQGPSDDLLTNYFQWVSLILLFFIMPFHVMLAWARTR